MMTVEPPPVATAVDPTVLEQARREAEHERAIIVEQQAQIIAEIGRPAALASPAYQALVARYTALTNEARYPLLRAGPPAHARLLREAADAGVAALAGDPDARSRHASIMAQAEALQREIALVQAVVSTGPARRRDAERQTQEQARREALAGLADVERSYQRALEDARVAAEAMAPAVTALLAAAARASALRLRIDGHPAFPPPRHQVALDVGAVLGRALPMLGVEALAILDDYHHDRVGPRVG